MSRHSRLIAVLAPSLAFSNVAFALTVNVSPTATPDCDEDNPTQTVCAETSVYKAIEAVNARGDATNVIDIDEVAYAPGSPEASTPVIEYPTTIRSDAANPAALPWRLQTIRATADLTLLNLAIRAGDVSGPFGSGEGSPQRFSAVDVLDADLTGTNLVFEKGNHFTSFTPPGRPNGTQGAYVREGDVTLTRLTATASGGEGYAGGVFLQDEYDSTRHDLVITDATFTDVGNHGTWSPAGIVTALGVDSATISNTTFTRASQYAIDVRGESLEVTDSAFDSTGSFDLTGGVYFTSYGGEAGEPSEVRIEDCSFIDMSWYYYGAWGDGAVRLNGDSAPLHARIEHSTFLGNRSSNGGAADVNFYGSYDESTLDVVDTTFDAFNGRDRGGSTQLIGGTARFVDAAWNGSGGEGGSSNAWVGGAIYARDGDLSCLRCSFAETSADISGGAVFFAGGEGNPRGQFVDSTFDATSSTLGGAVSVHGGDYSFLRTSFTDTQARVDGGGAYLAPYGGEGAHSTFVDSSFTNTTAVYRRGGAVSAWGSQYIEMSGVSFTDVAAGIGDDDAESSMPPALGTEISAGEGGGAVHLNTYEGGFWPQYGASYVYGGETGVTLIASDLTVDGARAPYGGVFYLEGPGHTLVVSHSSFANTEAVAPEGELPQPVAVADIDPIGLGGFVFTDPGNRIELHSSSVTGSSALVGGSLFSNYSDWYYGEYYEVGGNGGGALPCFYGYDYYDGPEYGTEWVIDGVSFADGTAELGASVALFGRHDNVILTASTITGNATEGHGTIVALNASRVDLSCNTFCDNEVGVGGSGIEMHDDGMYPEFEYYGDYYGGEQKDVRYELENNVFQGGVSGGEGGAVYVTTCPAFGGGQGGSSRQDARARGHVQVYNNTFVGNAGEANLSANTRDVRLDVRNNLFQDGDVGWMIGYGANFVEGGYNLYGDTVEDVIDDAGLGFDVLDATNQTQPAVFRSYAPGTCSSELYLAPGSPGIDDADPDPIWNDNWTDPTLPGVPNVGDIGAFGGRGACVPDLDHDTQNAIVDCDDTSRTTYVDAIEIPYDGIDQDCDGADLCDIDADGALAAWGACGGTDCNDLAPGIHPGATDIIGNGIDEDCSGSDALTDEDLDNDGHPDVQYGGHDCDDNNAAIHPSAEEIPYDGIDQDCDGEDLIDVDCDGFASSAVTNCPPGIECTDCDDDDATIFPGASDNPLDDIDQDCDGTPAELWAQGGLCGCSTPGAPTPVGGAFGVLAAALVFVRRRGQR